MSRRGEFVNAEVVSVNFSL